MLNLAASLKEVSEHGNALDICNRAIDLEPTFYKTYYRRGNIYQSLKQYDKALYI
jgi:tetratricopeptide (TPR) repeat protein